MGYLPGEPAYRRVTLALFAAGVATFALLYCTQPLLPELAGQFGLTPAESALSVSATTMGLGAALLFAGTASERLGRTRLIHASLLAAAVVGLLVAVAPTWPVLLALRAVQGVALSGLPAVAIAYLREEIAPAAQGGATGLYIGGTAIGGMSGRLAVGGVADLVGWRWGVAAVAAIGLGCAVVVRLTLPPSRNFHRRHGGLRAVRGMTRLILTDPGLWALYGIGGMSMGAFVAVYNTAGFRLAGAPYGLSLGVAGLVYLTYATGLFSAPYAGRRADALGRRSVLPVVCAVQLLGLLVTLGEPLWLVVAGLAVFSAGFFAVHGVASGWVALRAGRLGGGSGQAAAFYLFCYYLGSSVFGSVAGVAWAARGWSGVVTETGILLVLMSVLSLALRRIPSRGATADPGITAY